MALNGMAKRIASGVGIAVILFLAGAVLSNSNRITAMEVKIESLTKAADNTLHQVERNRIENREENRVINDKLDNIAKEIRK